MEIDNLLLAFTILIILYVIFIFYIIYRITYHYYHNRNRIIINRNNNIEILDECKE